MGRNRQLMNDHQLPVLTHLFIFASFLFGSRGPNGHACTNRSQSNSRRHESNGDENIGNNDSDCHGCSLVHAKSVLNRSHDLVKLCCHSKKIGELGLMEVYTQVLVVSTYD